MIRMRTMSVVAASSLMVGLVAGWSIWGQPPSPAEEAEEFVSFFESRCLPSVLSGEEFSRQGLEPINAYSPGVIYADPRSLLQVRPPNPDRLHLRCRVTDRLAPLTGEARQLVEVVVREQAANWLAGKNGDDVHPAAPALSSSEHWPIWFLARSRNEDGAAIHLVAWREPLDGVQQDNFPGTQDNMPSKTVTYLEVMFGNLPPFVPLEETTDA